MGPVPLPSIAVDPGVAERVASALRTEGYVIVDDALPAVVVDALADSLRRRHRDEFRRAGIGRDEDYRRRPTVRGDLINWLEGDDESTRWFLAWAELLRLELNRRLFLGLFEYECHFAWYPVGAGYGTHLDAFRGESNRVVSSVLYLNPSWDAADGGELVIHRGGEWPPSDTAPLVVERIVLPEHGRLVLFLSEEFPHEVLPATKPRFSIAGWYRLNASTSERVDPPPAVPDVTVPAASPARSFAAGRAGTGQ